MHGFIHKIISQRIGDEISGRSRKRDKTAPGATTKLKQQSQPKACSLKQEPPRTKGLLCVFSNPGVVRGP